ncbi:hypothetical protein R5R35_005830 [Gryllus longicercus]|uniref:Snurportin-1 n=1 Tax=Gryllus longicercus TaxID=2509291 RepID=A0AAN9Z6L2_9ORTH
MSDGEKLGSVRLSQYKPRNTGSSQEERRKFLLEHQKRLREESFNEGRNIVEEINTLWHKTPRQRNKLYKKKFMLSEWLMEIPSDFKENWIMVPCPIGKRVLVLAGKGMTLVFAKDGRVLSRFRSNLPGGHMESGEPSKGVTLLDCIWSKCNRSYYILDVLAWNNQHLTNCETEFRFFWLRTKLTEGPDMVEISQSNTYPFFSLPTFQCDKETLEICLKTPLIPDVTVDGLLFYHSKAHYTNGHTPLVGWLKPFMIPDLMQISICAELLVEQPQNYAGYLHYITEFEEKVKNKHSGKQVKQRQRRRSRKMEVVEADPNVQEEMNQIDSSEGPSVQDFSEGMDHADEESEDSIDASSEENNT